MVRIAPPISMPWLASESWNVFAVPAKVVEIAGGMPICSFSALMRVTLSPSATPLRQIVGNGHGWKLAELVDGQRAGGAIDAGEGAERHQAAAGCPHLDGQHPFGRPRDLRIELE